MGDQRVLLTRAPEAVDVEHGRAAPDAAADPSADGRGVELLVGVQAERLQLRRGSAVERQQVIGEVLEPFHLLHRRRDRGSELELPLGSGRCRRTTWSATCGSTGATARSSAPTCPDLTCDRMVCRRQSGRSLSRLPPARARLPGEGAASWDFEFDAVIRSSRESISKEEIGRSIRYRHENLMQVESHARSHSTESGSMLSIASCTSNGSILDGFAWRNEGRPAGRFPRNQTAAHDACSAGAAATEGAVAVAPCGSVPGGTQTFASAFWQTPPCCRFRYCRPGSPRSMSHRGVLV